MYDTLSNANYCFAHFTIKVTSSCKVSTGFVKTSSYRCMAILKFSTQMCEGNYYPIK